METSPSLRGAAPNRVRELREELLLTRDDLARRAGVSLRTVWSVEAGHNSRVDTKRAILRALGVSRSRYREIFPLPVRGFSAPGPEAPAGAHSSFALA
jgi:transcriptional regulator with XRE-family HTH domain